VKHSEIAAICRKHHIGRTTAYKWLQKGWLADDPSTNHLRHTIKDDPRNDVDVNKVLKAWPR
jgi:hypothetical protein